jgi:hypothetical protein
MREVYHEFIRVKTPKSAKPHRIRVSRVKTSLIIGRSEDFLIWAGVRVQGKRRVFLSLEIF